MLRTAFTACSLTVGFALSTTAQADILSKYTFEDTDAPSTVASGVEASDITTEGFGDKGYVTIDGSKFRAFDLMNVPFDSASDYWAFDVTAQTGATIEFASFTVDYNRENSNAADEWALRASTINSDAAFAAAANLDAGTLTDVKVTNSLTVPLTSLADVTAGNTQYFRFYTFSAASSSRPLRLDNLTLNGTSTIPEPGSLALLGLGGLCLMPRRRK